MQHLATAHTRRHCSFSQLSNAHRDPAKYMGKPETTNTELVTPNSIHLPPNSMPNRYQAGVILLNSYSRVPLACSRPSGPLLVVSTVSRQWPQLLVGDIASAQSGLP